MSAGRSHRRALVGVAAVAALLAGAGLPGPAAGEPRGGCGSGWHIVSSPSPGSLSNDLADVAIVGPNEAWAVGSFDDSPDVGARTLTLRWDGVTWTHVPSPNVSEFDNVLTEVAAVPGGGAVAVGYFMPNEFEFAPLVLGWDGSAWRVVPAPEPGQSSVLWGVDALSRTEAWAVGHHDETDHGGTQALALRWTGRRWRVAPTPQQGFFDSTRSVDAIASDDVWAVGYDSSPLRPIAMHFDGTGWDAVPTAPVLGDPVLLEAVSGTASDDVWAVGQRTNKTMTQHWDGAAWSLVSSPNEGSFSNVLLGVDAVASDLAWAVGNHGTASGSLQTLIQYWNGARWIVVPSPNASALTNSLNGVDAVMDEAWAVGIAFVEQGGGPVRRTLVLHLCR